MSHIVKGCLLLPCHANRVVSSWKFNGCMMKRDRCRSNVYDLCKRGLQNGETVPACVYVIDLQLESISDKAVYH